MLAFSLFDGSLFDFYRRLLTLVLCTYFVVRIVTAVTHIRVRVRSADRREAMMVRYFGNLALRIRFRRFRMELIQVAGLLVVLGLLIAAHR